MWYEESVVYQIYPLGACGAPIFNDGIKVNRIEKIYDYIPQMQFLGVDTVLFNPLFESDKHGYDTRDYLNVDVRLGDNKAFKQLCERLHEEGFKIMLDGVFNHVGRGFWAFQDVIEKKQNSPYFDWFYLNMEGDSDYHDGFYYVGWEGVFDLVKLNLNNREVVDYLLKAVKFWIDEFKIDGLRLDVGYSLDHEFVKTLRSYTTQLKPDFFLLGESLHGDYNQLMNDEMCHSVTNYECYKGIYSSFNSMNLFEINHSLLRQFGKDPWCLYRGKHLLNFVDNHDVTRIASILTNPKHIKLAYGLLFTMPGIPCIYYGSEWGSKGLKQDGDEALRTYYETVETNTLTDFIANLSRVYHEHSALRYGEFESISLTNSQCVYARDDSSERLLVAINASGEPYMANFDAGCAQAEELLSKQIVKMDAERILEPYSIQIWKLIL